MIKVLEHGRDYHETSCIRCNAKISYLQRDIEKSFVKCPECNFMIRVHSLSIEETNLKNSNNHKPLVDLSKINSWEDLEKYE